VRVRKIEVTFELIADWFKSGVRHYEVISDAFPNDARVLSIQQHPNPFQRNSVFLLVESSEFDDLPEGAEIPIIESSPTFKRLDKSEMKILLWSRQMGKTTMALKKMTSETFYIAPTSVMSRYAKEMIGQLSAKNDAPLISYKHFMSVKQFINTGLEKCRLIIDEIDFIDTNILLKLIRENEVVLMTGTPQPKSPNFSWLTVVAPEKIDKKTYQNDTNFERKNYYMKMKENLSEELFRAEFMCEFKGSI
jgi:hypothetical protein